MAVEPRHSAFQRIMLPLDGSEGAERVLQMVVPLASRLGAELTLLHVLIPRQSRPVRAGEISYPDTLHDRARALASDYLSEVTRSLVQSRVRVKTVISAGDVPAMILSHAGHTAFSMIALGVHFRNSWFGRFHRTVVERIWTGLRVPVFVVNTSDLTEEEAVNWLPKSVLVVTSGPVDPNGPLGFAEDLALAGGFTLTYLGVQMVERRFLRRSLASRSDDQEELLEARAAELRQLGASVDVRILGGPPEEAVQNVRLESPGHILVVESGKSKAGLRLFTANPSFSRNRHPVGPVIFVPRNA